MKTTTNKEKPSQTEDAILRELDRLARQITDRNARVHILCAIQDVKDWRNGKE